MSEATLSIEVIERKVETEVSTYLKDLPMVVKTAADCDRAKACLVEARKYSKERAKWFDEQILNDSHKMYVAAQKTWQNHKAVKAKLLNPIDDWYAKTEQNVLAFVAKERAAAAEKQRKANEAYAKKVAKAEEAGKDPELVRPPTVYAEPTKTVKTDIGAYTVRETKEAVVHDVAQIPDQYFDKVLNMKRIDVDLRAGVAIPGASLQIKLGGAVRG